MSLFIRLSIVVAAAVLLRRVPAALVITAPSTVTDSTAGLETREQGPTAWICSALTVDSPWTSYANIRGYLEGGNAEKKDFSHLVLFPVMELFHASESRLCVYLPAEDHCYPPTPSTSHVKAVKQFSKRNYYAIRFWGQASDARVQYYKQKLTAALTTLSKAANFDLFFVSFFSDHVREVRYDQVTTAQGKSAEPLKNPLEQLLVCPAAPGYGISGTTTQAAGQEYLHTTLIEARLSLSDVQTTEWSRTHIQNQGACGKAASDDGDNAFSFVNGTCKVYVFKKSFCPCATGNFDIYINTKLLGRSTQFINKQFEDGNFKKIVIYSEIPLASKLIRSEKFIFSKDINRCAPQLSASYHHFGAFVDNNQCYLTKHHDFANCNQTCRGKPVDVLVKKVNPLPTLPILSLCGQKIVVPLNESGLNDRVHFSHAGFGCYRYQGAKTAGGEDCIVTFDTDTRGVSMNMIIHAISLNSEGSTCHDVLSIYNDSTTADTSRQFHGCSWSITLTPITAKAAFTIKFHRGLSSEKNIGFKLSFSFPTY